jgi:uridine monophosphate synthetase
MQALVLNLYAIGAIKFGSFTLKSGAISPIYLDLRSIVSYPKLVKEVCATLHQKMKNLSFDCICGVPYTALPIASCLSVTHEIPMLMRRKEAKNYGTKKMIEGSIHPGQTCLIIEDVITSGGSVLETASPLQEEGVVVRDALVIIDREQGGRERLEGKGIRAHSLVSLSQVIQILKEASKIDDNFLL